MALNQTITRVKSALTGEEFTVGSSTLYETGSVIINAPTAVDWTQYTVNVTDTTTGLIQYVTLSSGGMCSFQIQYGHTYTVQLPIVTIYLQPSSYSFTASQPLRQIYHTYTIGGVFGIDYVGKKYTIAECEALTDKSVIIAGGYTDTTLEASSRDDGTIGNGFMWNIDNAESVLTGKSWCTSQVQFNTALLPNCSNETTALTQCNGEAYTRYMISEAARLNVLTPAGTSANAKTLSLAGVTKVGYIPGYGQIKRLVGNYGSMQLLYTALGKTAPTINSGNWWTSCQYSQQGAVTLYNGGFDINGKNLTYYSTFVVFDL